MPKTATLYLLGTETEYEQSKQHPYHQQETLSFCFDHTTSIKHIIDGPDTLGTNVGDKIAQSVITVLKWLQDHPEIENVNIAAHSRGAVQAILVANELQRLKDHMSDSASSLLEVLQQSPCQLTRDGFNKDKDQINGLTIGDFQQRLSVLKLNIFAVDPVPGGSFFGKNVDGVAWVDERQYIVPEIVCNYTQVLLADERSVCFTPIIPKAASESTNYHITVLPGHHGSASGIFTPQLGYEAYSESETAVISEVQKIALCTVHDFLMANGTEFKAACESDAANNSFSLDNIWQNYRDADKVDQVKFLLDSYEILTGNLELFQKFHSHTYFYFNALGQHWFQHERVVHLHSRASKHYLSQVPFLQFPSKEFINSDHEFLRLFLLENGEREGETLVEVVANYIARLSATIKSSGELIQKDLDKMDVLGRLYVNAGSNSELQQKIMPLVELAIEANQTQVLDKIRGYIKLKAEKLIAKIENETDPFNVLYLRSPLHAMVSNLQQLPESLAAEAITVLQKKIVSFESNEFKKVLIEAELNSQNKLLLQLGKQHAGDPARLFLLAAHVLQMRSQAFQELRDNNCIDEKLFSDLSQVLHGRWCALQNFVNANPRTLTAAAPVVIEESSAQNDLSHLLRALHSSCSGVVGEVKIAYLIGNLRDTEQLAITYPQVEQQGSYGKAIAAGLVAATLVGVYALTCALTHGAALLVLPWMTQAILSLAGKGACGYVLASLPISLGVEAVGFGLFGASRAVNNATDFGDRPMHG